MTTSTNPRGFVEIPRKVQVQRMEYWTTYSDEVLAERKKNNRPGPDRFLLVWAEPALIGLNTTQWSIWVSEGLVEHYGLPVGPSGVFMGHISEQDAKKWVIALGKMLEIVWWNKGKQ